MCTPEEKEKITSNACGNVSNFIRALALKNKKIKVHGTHRPVDPLLVEQVRRLGVSINQIAKVVNAQNKFGNTSSVTSLNNSFLVIQNQLIELMEAHK